VADVIIGLGGNLPFHSLSEPTCKGQTLFGADLFAQALRAIADLGFDVRSVSNAWRTTPMPASPQPDFVNAVAVVDVGAASAQAAMDSFLRVERTFGRERRARWDARTLDIDIIDFAGAVVAAVRPGAIVAPHPRAHERCFVLAPLAEAAPAWRHPVLGKSAAWLLDGLAPQGRLERLGPIPVL